MGVKERLTQFVAYKRLSKRRFQASIGVSSSYIQGITNGMSADVLHRISSTYPDLNTDWLLTGEGEMLNPAPGITQHQNGGSNNSQTVTVGQSDVGRFLDEIAAQRRMTEKAQEQIDRLLTLLEKR